VLFLSAAFGWSKHKKKPPEGDLPGAFCCVLHHWKILNVSQHTSPERLVRVMVMMVVFNLNAVHKIL